MRALRGGIDRQARARLFERGRVVVAVEVEPGEQVARLGERGERVRRISARRPPRRRAAPPGGAPTRGLSARGGSLRRAPPRARTPPSPRRAARPRTRWSRGRRRAGSRRGACPGGVGDRRPVEEGDAATHLAVTEVQLGGSCRPLRIEAGGREEVGQHAVRSRGISGGEGTLRPLEQVPGSRRGLQAFAASPRPERSVGRGGWRGRRTSVTAPGARPGAARLALPPADPGRARASRSPRASRPCPGEAGAGHPRCGAPRRRCPSRCSTQPRLCQAFSCRGSSRTASRNAFRAPWRSPVRYSAAPRSAKGCPGEAPLAVEGSDSAAAATRSATTAPRSPAPHRPSPSSPSSRITRRSWRPSAPCHASAMAGHVCLPAAAPPRRRTSRTPAQPSCSATFATSSARPGAALGSRRDLQRRDELPRAARGEHREEPSVRGAPRELVPSALDEPGRADRGEARRVPEQLVAPRRARATRSRP